MTLLGRPNSGKSTLVNAIVGTKVAIVSDKAQTTRHAVRGVLHRDEVQVVFVDTPGIHKPRTALGERLNATAADAADDVDVVCLCIDATRPLGRGDRFIAERLRLRLHRGGDQDRRCPPFQGGGPAGRGRRARDSPSTFPTSARTGKGVDALVSRLCELMPLWPAALSARHG